MSCPYLKEVRMVFCRAYPVKKLVPLDELVSSGRCDTDCAFGECAAFQEARARVEQAAVEGELVDALLLPGPRPSTGGAERLADGETDPTEKGRTP